MRIEEPGGPNAVTVDPDRPVYQVNLFLPGDYPTEVPDDMRGYRVEEWKIHDAEVLDVLRWAEDRAGVHPYTVSVASASVDGDSYLLRLSGRDPNQGEPDEGYFTAAPDGIVPDMQSLIDRARPDQGQ